MGLACPRTEPTSVSPECWRAAHLLGKQVRSRFIATTRPSLVAGTAANRLQDCCSRISVSAWTCSGVPVCWSTEHQGPAVEQRLRSWSSDTWAVPTSNLSTVGDRAFPIAAAWVWNTVAGRSFIQLCQLSKRRLKIELFSRSFPDWCDCVKFGLAALAYATLIYSFYYYHYYC